MTSPQLCSGSTWWTLAIFFHQSGIKEILDFVYHLKSEQLEFQNFRAPCNLSSSTPLDHWAVTDSFVVTWESSRHFAKPPLVFPQNDNWEMGGEILYRWCVTTQIWAVLLIGWRKFPRGHSHSKALPRSEQWHVISTEFLSNLPKHHFTRKQEVEWQIVSWFLMLTLLVTVAKWVTFPNHS